MKIVNWMLLLATTALTGCTTAVELYRYAGLPTINNPFYVDKEKLKREEFHKKIKANDLDASKECVRNIANQCSSKYIPYDDRLRAAKTVVKADLGHSEPEPDRLALLMKAYDLLINTRLTNKEFTSHDYYRISIKGVFSDLFYENPIPQNEHITYLKEVVRLSQSNLLYDAVVQLLVIDFSASGDLYRPFVCNLTPYQKELSLLAKTRDRPKPDSVCADAKEHWEIEAFNKIRRSINENDLAVAKRCILECEKIGKDEKYPYLTNVFAEDLRRSAEKLVTQSRENKPDPNDPNDPKGLHVSNTEELKEHYRFAMRQRRINEIATRIKAGDLDASKRCAMSVGVCPSYASSHHAAKNILKANLSDVKPELNRLALLMRAYDLLINNRPPLCRFDKKSDDKGCLSKSEFTTHLKAVIRLSQSKAIWDHANAKKSFAGEPSIIPNLLRDTVAKLVAIEHSDKTSGAPDKPFVCNLTPYQKEMSLITQAFGWSRDTWQRTICHEARMFCRGQLGSD
ncbi:MAG: hypothetical protein FWH55_12800 [Oscillospiraceae bacterium]|nr:hypothetical protein [Oscillospiraceae bacterium]